MRRTFLLLAVSFVPAAATAQSFNLDFGTTFPGLPGSYGAASGQTGTWNDLPKGTTNGLLNTSGAATPASVTWSGDAQMLSPSTTTDGDLLRDLVQADTGLVIPFTISLSGLQDGPYDVYYYGYVLSSDMTINGTPVALAGGSMDALGAQGTNWGVASGVVVSGGTLDIVDTVFDLSTGLSGLQLVPVAEEAVVPTLGTGGLAVLAAALLALGVWSVRRQLA